MMIRQRYIFTILTIFLFLNTAIGKTVTLTEVREVVYSLMDSWNKHLDIEKIEARYLPGGKLAYYMVDLGQEGWVMVSADDAVRPVLAFSFENTMPEENEWKEGAAYLVNLYKQEISVALKDQTLPRDKAWDREQLPSEKKATAEIAATVIDPFIDVTWDQGGGWNMFCPVDEDGPTGHAYVGCVAVAMAQAMSVHEYPEKPHGIKSYVLEDYGSIAVNYDMADPYNWNEMSATTADSYNAMLLYHCAVSVETDFGANGSGAFARTAASSIIQYFNYSTNVKYWDRFEDADEWEAALVAELAAGNPIVYRGQPEDGATGHAWNLDGYSDQAGSGSFHMNFGWTGSQNGYYTLDNIVPGSIELNSDQGAILGIAPPFSSPYDLSLTATSVSAELPDSSFVADVIVVDEDPSNIYSFACKGQYSIILDDYGPASFYIENKQLFTDKVFEFDEFNPENNTEFLRIIVEDQYGNEYTEDFEITIERPNYCDSADISISPQITQPLCYGGSDGSIDISVEGRYPAFTYSWSTGETTEDIENLSMGAYEILVTDSKGCTISEQLNMGEPSQILIQDIKYTPLCHDDSNGSIKIDISGGTDPYAISWYNDSPSDSIFGLTIGCYDVTVTDLNGCIQQENICLSEPGPLALSLTKRDNICFGDSSGTIYYHASGGTPDYHYQWENLNLANGNLIAGTYTITVIDANSCSNSDSITLIDPKQETVDNIIGNDKVEEFVTYTYSLTERENYIYHWIVERGNVLSGQGTHVVDIQWGSNSVGIINAYIESELGCLSDTTTLQVQISPVGTSPEVLTGLRIYPNPMSEYSIIEFPTTPPPGSTLLMSDISGRIIRKISINTGKRFEVFKDGLPPGIYIIEIDCDKHYREKLLIK
jgi:Peptidase C10 family/SprB repeat/Spi protease inhibitor